MALSKGKGRTVFVEHQASTQEIKPWIALMNPLRDCPDLGQLRCLGKCHPVELMDDIDYPVGSSDHLTMSRC